MADNSSHLVHLRQIPAGICLGFVSLLMDVSSEMIHALLPVYLVTALGVSTLTVGLIEGIAEATALVTKVFPAHYLIGSNGLSLQPDWFCFPAIVLVGAIPAVAMVVMLRRGAPLMPCRTVTLGRLAAAGLGNFGLRFFHPQDASLMVPVWQFGRVVILAALAGCLGAMF